MLGLNTCWVGVSFSKITSAVEISKGEEYVAAISLGYGETQGVAHRSKSVEELCDGLGVAPSWFRRGVECAMLAPSTLNHQNFRFEYSCGRVKAVNRNSICSELDLGIAKLHFEIGSEKDGSIWIKE